MINPNVNWVRIHRNLLINDLWKSEPFTKGQAWVDLLLAANWQDGIAIIKGVKIPVKRGQVCRAMKQLAIRWQWSEGKVKRYLELLKDLGQVSHENWNKNGAQDGAHKTAVTTLITIANYDFYQHNEATDGAKTAPEQSANGAQTVPYKKEKKVEKEKKESKPLPPEALRLSELLAGLIQSNHAGNSELTPSKREYTLARWADSIDKINRIDGRDWADIESVIEWCQQDSFWSLNIMSGVTLRKQFDKLSAKFSAQTNTAKPYSGPNNIFAGGF